METRKPKVPVDLEELVEDKEVEVEEELERKKALRSRLVKEKPQKRSLGYMRNPGGGGGGGRLRLGGGGGGGFSVGGGTFSKQNIILIGLAVLIAFSVSLFVFARKGDAQTLFENQQILQTAQNDNKSNIKADSKRIDNIIESYATKDNLNNKIANLDLSSYITSEELSEAVGNITSESYWITGNKLHIVERPGIYTAKVSLIYTKLYTLDSVLDDAYKSFSTLWTGQNFTPEFVWSGTNFTVASASYYLGSLNVTKSGWVGNIGAFTAPGKYMVGVEVFVVK